MTVKTCTSHQKFVHEHLFEHKEKIMGTGVGRAQLEPTMGM